MILESEDLSQKAGKVPGRENTMKRELMDRKGLFTRRDDSANIAEADLPRRPDRSTMVAAEVEIEPADYYRKGRVGAHGDEE